MFYSLTGEVVHRDLNFVAISCSGVAYRCYTSQNTLIDISGENSATLFTYLSVKENAMEIFGFSTMQELDWFKMLIAVSGVGPRAAINILSMFSVERLFLLISSGDAKQLSKAQGIGAKTAQKVILELKDKIKSIIPTSINPDDVKNVGVVNDLPNSSEAIEALLMLGYSQSEASLAVSKIDPELKVEQIIKQALKILSS